MNKILITGKDSYVGNNVEKWLMKKPNRFNVESLDMKNSNWKKFDFKKIDTIFHVAGIAHVSTKKSLREKYFKINRDLAIETAKIAKNNNVKHFIFMSSAIVYSSKENKITKSTIPSPDNFYGESKLQAELGLLKLADKNFKISIVRSPMIYGEYSKGNFLKLVSFLKKTKFFPKIKNIRSVIYIENFARHIEYIIDNKLYGILFPQNKDYFDLYKFSNLIKEEFNDFYYFKLFNPIILFLSKFIKLFNSLFSNFYYSKSLSEDFSKLELIETHDTYYRTVKSDE